jgi:Family of unknown function (DUF5715)
MVMLSILRTLPMVRKLYIVLLLVVFAAASASASTAHHARTHRSSASAKAHHHTSERTSLRAHRRSPRHASSRRATHLARSTRPQRKRRYRRTNVVYHYPRLSRASFTRTRSLDSPSPESPRRTDRTTTAQDPVREDESTPESRTADLPSTDAPTPETSPETQPLERSQPAEPAASAPVETSSLSLRPIRIVPLPPLRGTHASLVRQNERSDAENLERILDNDDLDDRIARGMLVPVPVSAALVINQSLPWDRRYCRPWTARFLADLARAHDVRFHSPLEVSSAVRTVDYQKRLIGINGNAAPAEGDIVSPHVTGATIDIAKHDLTAREIYWMRDRLSQLQQQGKIDVEEEFEQACFHITVYKSYVTPSPAHKPRPRAPAPTSNDEDDSAGAAPIPATGR